jgi:hypothetical protein
MQHRTLVVAIAAVLVLPLIFAALGGTQRAGLMLGVALVVIGLLAGLLGGARTPRDGRGGQP